MKKISIFTPCYNEEENIKDLYNAVSNVMAKLPQYDYEYVFIDNCSQDKTPEILKEIAERDSRVKAIFNLRNFGPERSGIYGFMQTSGDATISLACDFQDPPEMIPEFIRKWEEGYKVAWGKKKDSDEGKLMFAIRTLYYKIIKLFSDVPQYEHVTGFGLYDKEVLDWIRKANDPNQNLRNMIPDLGYDVAIIVYHQPKRKAGKSSYNFYRYFDTAMSTLINTSRTPLRLVTFIGLTLSGICFFIGLFYLILKLVFWNSFSLGTAPLVVGVFFLGSVQSNCQKVCT